VLATAAAVYASRKGKSRHVRLHPPSDKKVREVDKIHTQIADLWKKGNRYTTPKENDRSLKQFCKLMKSVAETRCRNDEDPVKLLQSLNPSGTKGTTTIQQVCTALWEDRSKEGSKVFKKQYRNWLSRAINATSALSVPVAGTVGWMSPILLHLAQGKSEEVYFRGQAEDRDKGIKMEHAKFGSPTSAAQGVAGAAVLGYGASHLTRDLHTMQFDSKLFKLLKRKPNNSCKKERRNSSS